MTTPPYHRRLISWVLKTIVPHRATTHVNTSDNLCLSTSTSNDTLKTPQDPLSFFRNLVLAGEQQDDVIRSEGSIESGVKRERREVNKLNRGLEFRCAITTRPGTVISALARLLMNPNPENPLT